MLHAAAVATRRRSGHRLRRPVGPRQDHRVARARPRVRLRHRRDAGDPARRRRSSPTPSRSRSASAPTSKRTEAGLGAGLTPAAAEGAAPRRARAARPPARRRAARTSSRCRADRRAGRARSPDELPDRARATRSARSPRSCMSTGGVRRVVYSEADALPALVDEILADDEPRPSRRSPTSPTCPSATATASTTCSEAPLTGPAIPTRRRPSRHLPAREPPDALLVDDQLLVLIAGRRDRARRRRPDRVARGRTTRPRTSCARSRCASSPSRPTGSTRPPSSPRCIEELVDGELLVAELTPTGTRRSAHADRSAARPGRDRLVVDEPVVAAVRAPSPRGRCRRSRTGSRPCAATQNRSNCAWTMRLSSTATASVPNRGSTRQSTTSTPIHITMKPMSPMTPADRQHLQLRLRRLVRHGGVDVPVAEAVAEDRRLPPVAEHLAEPVERAGTRSCTGSARRSGRRPSSTISHARRDQQQEHEARATRGAATDHDDDDGEHEADERLP